MESKVRKTSAKCKQTVKRNDAPNFTFMRIEGYREMDKERWKQETRVRSLLSIAPVGPMGNLLKQLPLPQSAQSREMDKKIVFPGTP